jgi:hypothetical protein
MCVGVGVHVYEGESAVAMPLPLAGPTQNIRTRQQVSLSVRTRRFYGFAVVGLLLLPSSNFELPPWNRAGPVQEPLSLDERQEKGRINTGIDRHALPDELLRTGVLS